MGVRVRAPAPRLEALPHQDVLDRDGRVQRGAAAAVQDGLRLPTEGAEQPIEREGVLAERGREESAWVDGGGGRGARWVASGRCVC